MGELSDAIEHSWDEDYPEEDDLFYSLDEEDVPGLDLGSFTLACY